MSNQPRPEIAVDGFPRRSRCGWMDIVTSADHKDVAKILMVGSGGFLFLAALELFLMRLQLAIPENTFMEPYTFNRILSLYGATSIFFFVLPLIMGLFLYIAPLQVGARGTALPRLSQIGGLALGRRRGRPLLGLPLDPVGGRRQPAAAPLRARLPQQQRGRRLAHRLRLRHPRLRPHLGRPRHHAAGRPRARDGLAPRPDLRLGRRRRLLADALHRPRPARRLHDAADRPQLRRHLLRRRRRRRAAPLAALHLDLLLGRLHAGADLRLRRDRRNLLGLLRQRALQPQRGDGLDRRDRRDRHARLHAEHVHRPDRARLEVLRHADVAGPDRPGRPRLLQPDRDAERRRAADARAGAVRRSARW